MTAFHPTNVFESIGELERPVVDASGPVLRIFENICQRLRDDAAFDSLPNELTGFAEMLMTYIRQNRHFRAWRAIDHERLPFRIRRSLLTLYQAQAHLPPNEPMDSRLRLQFAEQIERLRREKFLEWLRSRTWIGISPNTSHTKPATKRPSSACLA